MVKQHDAKRSDVEGVEYSTRERLAGAFIIVAILLLMGAVAFSSQIAFLLADTFVLRADVDTAEGIGSDATVKFAGIEIGRVTAIELTSEHRISLTLKIREKYHDIVRADSVALVNRMAILGDVTIEITRGDPSLPLLKDGAHIPVEETATLDTMLARLAPAVDDIIATTDRVHAIVATVEPKAVAQITDNLRRTLEDIRATTASINEGKGTVGRLFNDEQLALDVTASITRLTEVLELTEARLKGLKPVLDNAAARTEEMEALLAETTALVDTLDGTVESLGANQGDAISGVLLEARSALDEAEKTLRAIRNTWPFSGSASEERPVEAVPSQPPTD